AAGIAMIGNVWALLMFAVGLLAAQYSPALLGLDLNALYVPHGVMIGAGVVALVQIVVILAGRQSRREADREAARERAAQDDPSLAYTVSRATLGRALGSGYVLFVLGALVLALAGGVWTDMSLWGIVGFVLFAGVAALVHELIVGLAAMQDRESGVEGK